MGAIPRLCLILLLAAASAFPQRFSFGLKGGVPLTDALKVTDRSRYFSDKAPWVLGPAVQLRLAGGLSAEADLFYRRLHYTQTTQDTNLTVARTTGQAWEIPLLARFQSPGLLFKPFVGAGFSFRRVANLDQRTLTTGSSGAQSSGEPAELTGRSTAGATLAGGVEVGGRLVRVSAEIRYTRWGSSSFRSALTGLATQLNQADFLLGIMF